MAPPRHKRNVSPWPSRIAFGPIILAYLALPVAEALFILKSSANIPISDTWGYVGIIVKFTTTGSIKWSHITRFYGDGRPVLERFGLLMDAKYFGLNVQLVKLGSVVVGILETACAIWAVRLALPRARNLVVLVAAYPVALAIFCWSNWQNLLDEWNLMNLAAVALSFLAVLLAVRLRSGRGTSRYVTPLAILVCAVASFTGESGTLSWIACGLVLWVPLSRSRLVEKFVFSGIGVVFLAVYFSGDKKVVPGHPLHHLAKVVEFALSCLGNGLLGGSGSQLGTARAFGIAEVAVVAILAGLFVANRRFRQDGAVQVALGLIAFSFMGAVATGVSRVSLGLSTSMSSRYVVLSFPALIGIYLVLLRLLTTGGGDRARFSFGLKRAGLMALPCLFAIAFCAFAVSNDVDQARPAGARHAYYVALKHMACDPGAYTTAQLSRFDHTGDLKAHQKKLLLVQISDLRRAKLSVFSDGYCKAYLQHSTHGSTS
ncbi:MAG: hypothetical protein ABSG36_11175 [Acidimicrobiales bacterium]|jgi:hypothetical protein